MQLRANVFPRQRRTEALAQHMCLYTVSLGLSKIRNQLMVRGYQWATNNFSRVNLCLGDGPLLEISLRTLGIAPKEAADRSRQIAANVLEQLNAARPVVMLSPASVVQRDSAFQKKHQHLRIAHSRDLALRDSVRKDAARYIQRLIKGARLGISQSEALKLATEYILIEIAIYAHLSDQGFWVDVYTGEELPTLKQFMQGAFEGFPELNRRAIISLKAGD